MLNRSLISRVLASALIFLLGATPVMAHFVWVVFRPTESGETKAYVYFNESPKAGEPELISRLDDLQMRSLGLVGEGALKVPEVLEDSLCYEVAEGDLVFAGSHDFGVMERGESKFRLQYHFKALRSQDSPEHHHSSLSSLELDAVTRFDDSGKVIIQALWQGEPVEGVELVYYRPNKAPQKATVDPQGLFVVDSPEAGMHALRLKYAPGPRDNEMETRHYTTLTFSVPERSKASLGVGPELPVAVSSFGAASLDQAIYVYGGHAGRTHRYSTETTSGRFFRWVPRPYGANSWEELPSGVHVQGVALVAHDDSLYRLGGMRPRNAPGEKADNRSVASCSRFDVTTQKWSSIPSLPEPRSSFDASVWGSHLVIAGGWGMKGEGASNKWYKTALMLNLDSESPEWVEIEQPFARRALSCEVLGDQLYVVGGMTPEGDMHSGVDILDLNTMKWTKGPSIPGKRFNAFTPALCRFGTTLYLNPTDGFVYELTDNRDAWKKVIRIQEDRFVHRMRPLGQSTMVIMGGASEKEGNRTLTELIHMGGGVLSEGIQADKRESDTQETAKSDLRGQTHCPVMRKDFVYEDSDVVEYQGVQVRVCCLTCAEKWKAEPHAYIDLEILPQLAGLTIPPREIDQKFCLVYPDRVVSSKDPSVEHNGQTYYFFNRSAKSKFLEAPEKYLKSH